MRTPLALLLCAAVLTLPAVGLCHDEVAMTELRAELDALRARVEALEGQQSPVERADPKAPIPAGHGRVLVGGDAARVWLVSEEARVKPGDVEPGTYEVIVFFDDSAPVEAGGIEVSAGETMTLLCDRATKTCPVQSSAP